MEREIILENFSNFSGDVVFETSEYGEDQYDHLFKKIRNAIKNRGLLGGLGQVTGLSTEAGSERRKARREAKKERKQERLDAKVEYKQALADKAKAEADAATQQAQAVTDIAQQGDGTDTSGNGNPQNPQGQNNNTLYMIGGVAFVLLLLIAVMFFMRSRPGAVH